MIFVSYKAFNNVAAEKKMLAIYSRNSLVTLLWGLGNHSDLMCIFLCEKIKAMLFPSPILQLNCLEEQTLVCLVKGAVYFVALLDMTFLLHLDDI